jgi:hypothetical protein
MTISTSSKSFFEYLGLADVERIHSQFLAWVFSPNCDAIASSDKEEFFFNLFGIRGPIISVQTEKENIDIIIESDKDVVIIENKIKSSQHSDQLERYVNYCEKNFKSFNRKYFFLTLVNEKTQKPKVVISDTIKWEKITYSDIYHKGFKLLNLKPKSNQSAIIQEYILFLKRLDSVLSDFQNNTIKYDKVFLEGGKKKQDKIQRNYNENEWFIASNQLETILQKCFLMRLVDEMTKSDAIVSETHGDALVDFYIEKNIMLEGRAFKTMLELQGSNLKFIFSIQEGYLSSDKSWITKIEQIMDQLAVHNKFDYRKVNKPKKLAYISISKKINGYYWHESIDALAKKINLEISYCQEMTSSIKELLN